jgi:hypothetical protein
MATPERIKEQNKSINTTSPPAKQEYQRGPPKPSAQEGFFFEHYKHQLAGCFADDSEFEAMRSCLKSPLPLAFRINTNCPYPERIKERLRTELQFEEGKHTFGDEVLGPPKCMPWYPDQNGWFANVSRPALRKVAKTVRGNLPLPPPSACTVQTAALAHRILLALPVPALPPPM